MFKNLVHKLGVITKKEAAKLMKEAMEEYERQMQNVRDHGDLLYPELNLSLEVVDLEIEDLISAAVEYDQAADKAIASANVLIEEANRCRKLAQDSRDQSAILKDSVAHVRKELLGIE